MFIISRTTREERVTIETALDSAFLKMFRQYKAEKAQSRVTKENGRVKK